MNKNEFVQMRNGWLNAASDDIRNKAIDFMEHENLNDTQLAEMLDVSVNEVRNVLHGGNMSLQTFASLLIATGNIIEIKPVAPGMMRGMARPSAAHPSGTRQQNPPRAHRNEGQQQGGSPMRDSRGRFIPRGMQPMGGCPEPPRGMNRGGGMPMPPAGDMWCGMPIAPNSNTPRRQAVPSTSAVGGVDLDSLTRAQLIDEVQRNHWESEIDLLRADRPQIIAFLESKSQQMFGQQQGMHQPAPQQPMQQHMVEERQMPIEEAPMDMQQMPMEEANAPAQQAAPEGSVSSFMGMILNELKNNPQLVNQFASALSGNR